MCGIIGYIGDREARKVLLSGLKRMEYRGYDSAGVALMDENDELLLRKDKGYVEDLEKNVPATDSTQGIGHTRWATHGPPSKKNSHPFTDNASRFALAHNGIIDNFPALKESMISNGAVFSSETDSEVLVHMLAEHAASGMDLEKAMVKLATQIEGSYAVVAIDSNDPNTLVALRNESPLVVGIGEGEYFLASDVSAFLDRTNRVQYINDGELVIASRQGVVIKDMEGTVLERDIQELDWKLEDAEKGGFDHFMLKEIFEQPSAIQESMLESMPEQGENGFWSVKFNTIKIVACGTSYHAGMVGKNIIERLTRVPVTVEMASEYRYSSPINDKPLVIVISQSGETLDTLMAMRTAKMRGCKCLAITNIVGSSITREADSVIYTRAGPEIGVAATKTYITQLVSLYRLALMVARVKGTVEFDRYRALYNDLRTMPRITRSVLAKAREIEQAAHMLKNAKDVFFIGRGSSYPVALEGALKLKEISYIHAEGYPGGELKHGPLALVTEKSPIVALAPMDSTYTKMLGNIGEMSARGAPVLAVGYREDRELSKYADLVLTVPKVHDLFSPFPLSLVMQLLSYYTANLMGCNIDKPRNLAKSVTVE